ncbi:MAG TPA: neutral zinc metallopeptidase, partial [Ilumatobacteraceae bacterium]|nr:neutral zinc metallopeptidase [Ilumatobacteraceae bacterium]
MTKIRKEGSSSQIQDRRSQSSGGAAGGGLGDLLGGMLGGGGSGGGGGGLGLPTKMGGGLLGIIVMVAALFLPRLLNGAGTQQAVDTRAADGSEAACSTEIEQIVCGGTEDVQDFWEREFAARGERYTTTQTVFFSGATNTGCGRASSNTGPFFCPADDLVYFDLDFLLQLQSQFKAEGDLAAQYIVAHEYGHYVQDLLGINAEMTRLQQRNPSKANQYSVALELQADCLAGVWANDAAARGQFDSSREINEALNAAEAVGDDRIQQQSQGYVDPDSFTHGTSEQRKTWF